MKKGEKLEIEKLEKPAFMTDGEWQATLETLSMLNQTIPDEAWKEIGEKVTSLDRIRSDGWEDREKFLSTEGREFTEPGVAPTLLLTTIGRKSGKEITTPVNGMRDGDNYYRRGLPRWLRRASPLVPEPGEEPASMDPGEGQEGSGYRAQAESRGEGPALAASAGGRAASLGVLPDVHGAGVPGSSHHSREVASVAAARGVWL